MEILVRIIDKEGGNSTNSKAGDVISICPDDWNWTKEERENDFWRIIKAPILQTLATALMSQPFTEQDKINKGYRFRDWKIDFSELPDPSLFFGKRTIEIINMTKEDILLASKQKP